MRQNDSLEVGGIVPSPLRPKPDTLGREADAPSVTSLERANWAESEFLVGNDYVTHRPTYARRNTRFEVSSRASGEYPTLAEAITLPRGPSESEQVYDSVTWPLLIMPAAFLVPVGMIFEPWFAVAHESPSWEYQRHPQNRPAPDQAAATGDPLVDRLGMPVLTEEPAPIAGTAGSLPPTASQSTRTPTARPPVDDPAPAAQPEIPEP